ncbi:MAG: Bug family tripartite tricarboxylate transporter substrate binding protein [Clostridia bacterium]
MRIGKGKKYLVLVLSMVCIAGLSLVGGAHAAGSYPEKPIEVIIPWSPGGMTDTTARAIQPLLERSLGQPLVMTNMPGASGAIGTDYVYKKKADGYTILFSAETPAGVMQVMGLADLSFAQFEPIMILTQGVPTITVHRDAPWKTVKELLDDAKAHPGVITGASSGPGASAHIASLMLQKYADVKLTMVPFAGGGPAVTAALGRHVSVTFQSLPEVIDHVRAGNLRILATFTNERTSFTPDVPALGQEVPALRQVLPWGTFYAIVVKKGTPPEIVDKLRGAVRQAVNDPKWKEFVAQTYSVPLNLEGEAATKFIDEWASVTSWLLYEAGAATASPEKFGIPKP